MKGLTVIIISTFIAFTATATNGLTSMTEMQQERSQIETISFSPNNVKGRVLGATIVTRRVESNSQFIDYITLEGGELASILIKGDGDTDLDLYLYDENGNLIEKDDDNSDTCLVSFTPKWTGTFKIIVKNHGSVYNNYILSSN